MKKYTFLIVPMLILLGTASAQNLVKNPSFETLEKMSSRDAFWLYSMNEWHGFAGICFHFHKDLRKDGLIVPIEYHKKMETRGYGVPFNFFGKQEPRTGKGYVAIELSRNATLQANENIDIPHLFYGELTKPLERGKVYQAELYASRADDYPATTNSLFFTFSDTAYITKSEHCDDYRGKIKPYCSNPKENYITETEGWQRVSCTFTAKGGEKYIAICSDVTPENRRGNGTIAFFIDDVSVTEVRDTFIIEPDKPLVLKNIVFATGKAELLPESFPELDKLLKYLQNTPAVNLEISGHTDNVGNAASNLTLSQNRAESVRKYLTDKGIAADRLTAKGYGDVQPTESNDTAASRAANRRVEVKILK